MSDHLHILNGLSTLSLFEKTDLSGDVCSWNEILVEGPVIEEIGTEDFWKIRKEYVSKTFGNGTMAYEQVIKDFEIIKDYKKHKEITLWFEYDLFCQINLMGLLSWFYQVNALNHVKITLVCVGNEPGYNKLMSLGQLPFRRYEELFEERRNLSEANLSFANKVWKAYCQEDPSELLFATIPHPVFRYIDQAIRAHLDRFPQHDTGLNEIEQEILEAIKNRNFDGVDTLVRYLLQWQKYYGFGDLQYFQYIKNMETFIDFGDPLRLNDFGEKVLAGFLARKDIPLLNYSLGGASTLMYVNKAGQIIKVK